MNANANANANGGVFRGLAYEKYDWSSDGDADAPAFRGRADASADVGRVTGFATRAWVDGGSDESDETFGSGGSFVTPPPVHRDYYGSSRLRLVETAPMIDL